MYSFGRGAGGGAVLCTVPPEMRSYDVQRIAACLAASDARAAAAAAAVAAAGRGGSPASPQRGSPLEEVECERENY